MSWAVDEVEELWTREDKVEDLRQEEKDEGFGEVTLYGDGGECHSSEIAKCIARECSRGIPKC
jgi:hypothetical protein